MAGKCAGVIQAKPGADCEQAERSPGRLLPEVLHERLLENAAKEAAHLVYDS